MDEVAGRRLRADCSPTFGDCNDCYFKDREAAADCSLSVGSLLEKGEPFLAADLPRRCVSVHVLASGSVGPPQGCL